MTASAEPLTFELENAQRVSGLLIVPPGARACYVFAHGAGAGMASRMTFNAASPVTRW